MAVIGDDPHLEITMARRAGALAIGVTTGIADIAAFNAVDETMRAHHVVASLEGLASTDWFTR
jgi:4-nitrophenyl phosphatase